MTDISGVIANVIINNKYILELILVVLHNQYQFSTQPISCLTQRLPF
jgi:hypothetical protein